MFVSDTVYTLQCVATEGDLVESMTLGMYYCQGDAKQAAKRHIELNELMLVAEWHRDRRDVYLAIDEEEGTAFQFGVYAKEVGAF